MDIDVYVVVVAVLVAVGWSLWRLVAAPSGFDDVELS